jgi:hypothetical protein
MDIGDAGGEGSEKRIGIIEAVCHAAQVVYRTAVTAGREA